MQLGPDAPIVENEKGGKQSDCPVSLVESFPHKAVLKVGAVVKKGLERYAPDNWRLIARKDHLNHALTHVFAYCSGDRQDDHLEHAACRLLMALETGEPADAQARSEKTDPRACSDPPCDMDGVCEKHSSETKAAESKTRKRVYIAGPITKGPLAENIRQASKAGVLLMKAGFAPLVPHLSCFMGGSTPEVLPCGTTHEDWYDTDLPWVAVADAVLRLPGESIGADKEVALAKEKGVPVFHTLEELLANMSP